MTPVKYIHVELEPVSILEQLQEGGPEVVGAFFHALKKIHSCSSLVQLNKDHGLNWEKLEGKTFPGTKQAMYTFRITLKWRALCTLNPGPVIEVKAVTTDHYGNK